MSSALDTARDLVPTVKARADETEATACVPSDLVAQFADAGFLRMFVPKIYDGPEIDPLTACEIVATISAADGSSGWTAFILNTSFFACYLEPAAAKEVLSSAPKTGMAGLFGPLGKAVPDGDGMFRVTGRWPFNSGSPHASWFSEGVFVFDDENGPPRMVDGQPDWRFAFIPAEHMEILDTWHVSGLRGTASHDVTTANAPVPEAHLSPTPMVTMLDLEAAHYRWPFFGLLSSLMAGFPLGVARRALDEFRELAPKKTRGMGQPIVESESVGLTFAHHDTALRAAHAFAIDTFGRAWDTALKGDQLDRDQRADLRSAALHAMRVAVDAVDAVFELSGGSALYDGNVIQRCWRDIHAGSHHIFFSEDHSATVGKALLGQETAGWFI